MKYRLIEECFYGATKSTKIIKPSDNYDELEVLKKQYIDLRQFNGEPDFFFYDIIDKPVQNLSLYLIRGISGSGKTTLAKTLESSLPDAVAFAADDFFCQNQAGEYQFDVAKLGQAHQWCKHNVELNMNKQNANIIVHNTFTSVKDLKPYLDLAENYNYKVISLIVENRHGNKSIHDVPEHTLINQQHKLEQNIKLI